MSFIHIFIRIRNLLLFPDREWQAITEESTLPRKVVFVQFVVPLLCVITVASILGSLLFASRTVFSFGFVVCKIAVLWTSLGAGLFLSSFVVTEIMARQVGCRDHNRVFSLMAYSFGTAYLVIAMVELFPFFMELLVLALYSCYLYWRGIPHLLQVRGQKQMIFGLLSLIIMTLVFSLVFFFFGNIMRSLFI